MQYICMRVYGGQALRVPPRVDSAGTGAPVRSHAPGPPMPDFGGCHKSAIGPSKTGVDSHQARPEAFQQRVALLIRLVVLYTRGSKSTGIKQELLAPIASGRRRPFQHKVALRVRQRAVMSRSKLIVPRRKVEMCRNLSPQARQAGAAVPAPSPAPGPPRRCGRWTR